MQMLYKYLHPDRIDVLQNCLIRFTQPRAFNDPFELKPSITKFTEKNTAKIMLNDESTTNTIKEIYDKQPPFFQQYVSFEQFRILVKKDIDNNFDLIYNVIESHTPMIKEAMESNLIDKLGILSLTKNKNNLLMWAHYAHSHEGFVIGFDVTHKYFNYRNNPKGEFGYVREVEYRDERPGPTLIDLSGVDIFLVKSPQWKYEEEWRIIHPLYEADKTTESSPYNIHLFKFPAELVREVIFGNRISKYVKENILTCLRLPHYRHVKVFQAELDDKEFKLNFIQKN